MLDEILINLAIISSITPAFSRAPTCPSPSPFPLKLETFLRANNVKFVSDFEEFRGPKGKSPWITLNGIDTPDSQFSIERLEREMGIDMDKG